MGLFGRNHNMVTIGKIDKRVSDLEDASYVETAMLLGGVKVGPYLFERRYGDIFISPHSEPGVSFGTVRNMRCAGEVFHVSAKKALDLRDWLLKEFPLEKPKKKGK